MKSIFMELFKLGGDLIMDYGEQVEIKVPFRRELIPLVVSCVEQSAYAFGLKRQEGLPLALAAEEIFSFLAAQAEKKETMSLSCCFRGYYVEAIFKFASRALPMKSLNITATVSAEDEKSLEDMGLLLAARSVDYLRFATDEEGNMALHFIKEKEYPEILTGQSYPNLLRESSFQIVDSQPELLKQFAARVVNTYGKNVPSFFYFPGKLVDMVASGEYGVVLLMDEKSNIGGGMLWKLGSKMVEAYGPYLFLEQPQLAQDLIEGCLGKIARTQAVCLVIRDSTPQAPSEYFEPLGNKALYRQLGEDNGAVAFVHPSLISFLENSYQDLFLPREVQEVEYQGERISPYSVFASQIDRKANKVVLSTLWVGADAEENLLEHVRALKQEGITNLLFELDAGVPEQAILGPALLTAGFVPIMVLPWGGRGDIIIFEQRKGEGL